MPLTAQAEDQTVNSLYFDTSAEDTSPSNATMDTIASKVDDLFNLAVGAGQPVRHYIAETTMAAQRVTYKFYNMDDTPPRVPIYQPVAQNMTPVETGGPLPSEVACCLSFRGVAVSGQNMAQRRGRIFVGPLNVFALATDSLSGHVRPAPAFVTALVAGANRFHDDLSAAIIAWCVYSPTRRGAGAAQGGCAPVSHVWVDNAFDTQRRRGIRPTARTSLDV